MANILTKSFTKTVLLSSGLLIAGASCNKKNDDKDSVPATTVKTTFTFERNGVTTVDYSGQTTRLAMLSEMVSYIKGQITNNAIIDAAKLKEMYAGTGFTNPELNTSGKQLKDKTYDSERVFFERAIDSLAVNSLSYGPASDGVSGIISNTDGSKKYLVDAKGVEWLQILEKGLMGAVFYYQATGTTVGYLDRVPYDNNTELLEDKNYTSMEHHFDEAFGYFGVPTNFPTDIPTEFWGKYCNAQDANISSNSIMTNFINARQAIVNNNIVNRDENIVSIKQKWEKLSAAQALTYLNDFKTKLSSGDKTSFHSLSEAYAFVYNLKFSNINTSILKAQEVTTLLNLLKGDDVSDINFYELSTDDINNVINELTLAYNL